MHEYSVSIISIGKQDLEAYPDTISQFWLKIEDMKSLYLHNQHFQSNIEKVAAEHQIMCWKKSRGDGNCYFRAVISTYFLSLCKPYTPVQLLSDFYNYVQKLSTSSANYDYEEAKTFILKQLVELYNLKYSGQKIQAYELALKLTQNREFDLNLVRISRLATCNEILRVQFDDDFSFLFIDGVDSIIYDVLEMGKEGGDHSLVFLPNALGIQVVQFMFLDQPQMSVQKFPENMPQGGSIVIRIVRRSGHYDILVGIQEFEMDQVDIDNGNYCFILNLNDSLDDEFYRNFQSIPAN